MTAELKTVIDDLYDKFSVYPLRQVIHGCPCCTSDQDQLAIHTKALKDLTADDLNNFSFSAMLTWGDIADFKHFLPRIFELLAIGKLQTDTFVVLGKLELAKWDNWEIDEQELIKQFLLAWWTDLTQSKSDFDSEAFIEISKRIKDVQLLLDRWDVTYNDNTFRTLIDFIYYNNYDLNTNHRLFSYKDIQQDTINTVNAWLIRQADKVEQAFFNYDKSEKEFAEKISVSFDILKGLQTATNGHEK